ncbi:WhiB family transcriptional regulator [Actinomadura citrea]|uniref:WhiB family transcriptional regulator n=1 Tax=Actinomadura citrea TaxID=46158 RepID=UPI003CE48376
MPTSISQIRPRIDKHRALTNGQLSDLIDRDATCRGATAEDWFPAEPDTAALSKEDLAIARREYEVKARQACAGCPAETACLLLALRDENQYGVKAHGISGGHAPWERNRLRRTLRRHRVSLTATPSREAAS